MSALVPALDAGLRLGPSRPALLLCQHHQSGSLSHLLSPAPALSLLVMPLAGMLHPALCPAPLARLLIECSPAQPLQVVLSMRCLECLLHNMSATCLLLLACLLLLGCLWFPGWLLLPVWLPGCPGGMLPVQSLGLGVPTGLLDGGVPITASLAARVAACKGGGQPGAHLSPLRALGIACRQGQCSRHECGV